MRVSSINFGSAYISNEVQHLLTQPQQHAIYDLGKMYSDKHIIAGLPALSIRQNPRQLLLRINDIISAKELSRVFLPLSFSPQKLPQYPRYIFHA